MLDSATAETLQTSFQQQRIHTVVLQSSATDRLLNEKFEGCVLPLNDTGEQVLQNVRTSLLNRRIVVYGVLEGDRPSARFLKLGVNVVLRLPIDHTEAVHRVSATTPLLIRELRRYVRIPLVMTVSVHVGGRSFEVMSRELSGGGMSVELCRAEVPSGEFRVVFGLPEKPNLSIRVMAAWHNEGLAGFQFDETDVGGRIVKDWIDKWVGTHNKIMQ